MPRLSSAKLEIILKFVFIFKRRDTFDDKRYMHTDQELRLKAIFKTTSFIKRIKVNQKSSTYILVTYFIK